MSTIDLDELERLAKAASHGIGYGQSPWDNLDLPQMDMILPSQTLAAINGLVKACSPSAILELITKLRRAERTWRDREPPHCATCDCGVPNG